MRLLQIARLARLDEQTGGLEAVRADEFVSVSPDGYDDRTAKAAARLVGVTKAGLTSTKPPDKPYPTKTPPGHRTAA